MFWVLVLHTCSCIVADVSCPLCSAAAHGCAADADAGAVATAAAAAGVAAEAGALMNEMSSGKAAVAAVADTSAGVVQVLGSLTFKKPHSRVECV